MKRMKINIYNCFNDNLKKLKKKIPNKNTFFNMFFRISLENYCGIANNAWFKTDYSDYLEFSK